MAQLSILLEALGYQFRDQTLLSCALTHKSARKKELCGEHGINNERLEFLGDAVLSLVTADFLYAKKPRFNEGELSRLRAQFVCHDNLSAAAIRFNLSAYIASDRIIRSTAVLSDAMEAIFGAVFIDGGLEAARRVIFRALGEPSIRLKEQDKDSKTKLQELVQGNIQQAPKYIVLDKNGPAHAPTYLVGVKVNNELVASATGENMKSAAQNAALIALETLKHEKCPESTSPKTRV